MTGPSRRHFLQGAGIAVAGTMLHPSIARALAIPADRRTGTIMDVQHIVILMQENRSFDHYYGSMRGVQGFADPHPAPLPGGRLVWDQKDKEGRSIAPFHLDTKKTAALKVADLPHSWQDATGAARGGRWDDWIAWKTPLTMGHYRREDIPFQYALAEAFTLCDAYHCSVHGQTNPNRLFIWAGGNDPRGMGGGPIVENSSGVALDYKVVLTPEMKVQADRYKIDLTTYGKGPRYTYTTYPERLENAGISWKVYQDPKDNFWGLTNPAIAFKAYNDAKPGEPLHDKAMARATIEDMKADALAGRLPQVIWIASPQSDSEHPEGSSPIEGANFTARVLDALTANPDVWARSVLFLNFDENDGFFDHVPAPSPPALNPDGSRAGGSTIDYKDDIHRDGIAYGLSVRVPMTVVSPWSTGGWVNSQVFDHTSVLRFIEKRFGVIEPNITPWRRVVSGDLTSAFDFSKPKPGKPSLPDTSDAIKRVEAALRLPKPVPPTEGQDLYQEPGTRPSRALPYAPVVEEIVSANGIALRFGNQGTVAIVYQVHDLNALDLPPRHYTVEPGKDLRGEWAGAHYHLQVRGPNGWYREYSGDVQRGSAAVTQSDASSMRVRIVNSAGLDLECRDLLAGTVADKRAGPEWAIPIVRTGCWYDIEIVDRSRSGFARRFSGRVETKRDSISRPGRRG
jgi:phospholipase C